MPKVFVGLSGGVDSSVAAALLKRADFEVTGVFMRFWQSETNACCSPESETRARLTAKKLQIPFYIFDFKKEFKKTVVDYFLKQTRLGLTPNPCVVCNEEIKFGLFLKKSLAMGADFIATGHYARKLPAGLTSCYILSKAKDKEKDQSYFLWRLGQEQLSRVIFPLGNYAKTEVRKMAKKFALLTAKIKDSQNLCFLASGPENFIKLHLKSKPGKIVDFKNKKIIGNHPGLGFFTIGQRQGIVPYLNSKEQSQGPYFVLKKEPKTNTLFITKNEKDLLSKEFMVSDVNFVLNLVKHKFPLKVKVKIRSRQKEVGAIILKEKKAGEVLVKLAKPERAVTPGQSAVFYQGQELLGGGIIL